MSKEIRIVTNATTAKVIDPNREINLTLTELLSYFVAGYENTYAYKNGKWDGKSTMYSWRTGTFPVGFLGTINGALVKLGYKVINISKPLPEPLGRVPATLGGFSYSDRYDYQWEGIKELEKRGVMISRFATGAGKTFHAALATMRIGRPTLILTKRQPLMYQFWDRLKDFGFDPGLAGDGRLNLKTDLTVAMSQTLSKKLEEPTNDEQREIRDAVKNYLNKVEFIIGEEVHEVSDNSYWNVIQNCPNAYYRLGLTGTPFMRGKSEANMRLLGSFSGIGMDVSEKTLIDRGINAKPIFKFAEYEKPEKLKFGSNYQKAVFEGITHCKERNFVILQHCQKAKTRKLPTLILVGRKDHGKVLKALLDHHGLKVEYIWGDTDSDKRKIALRNLSNGLIDVLIGSTIIDVGVDVPAIGLVILAGGGKAEVTYRQRIGRGLREKKTGPNVCFILDFLDEHQRNLNEHSLERIKVIKATPGFSENLLNRGEDLPWELFDGIP
jgi:superfamily II DNA or RNA helicase